MRGGLRIVGYSTRRHSRIPKGHWVYLLESRSLTVKFWEVAIEFNLLWRSTWSLEKEVLPSSCIASIVSTILEDSLNIIVRSPLDGPRSRGSWGQSKKSAWRSWSLLGVESPSSFTMQRIQYRNMWTLFSSNGHVRCCSLWRCIMGVPLNMPP
jgi:hypothetical protein